MPAVVAREAWREELCVLALLHLSICGVRKDCCRLGPQMVALGSLRQSWCGFWELWTKCFSGTPERCAGTRWDGDTVCKCIGNFCFDCCLLHSFLHAGVGGSKQHWVPVPPGVPAEGAPGKKELEVLEMWWSQKLLSNARGYAGRAARPDLACDSVDTEPPWTGIRPCSAASQP